MTEGRRVLRGAPEGVPAGAFPPYSGGQSGTLLTTRAYVDTAESIVSVLRDPARRASGACPSPRRSPALAETAGRRRGRGTGPVGGGCGVPVRRPAAVPRATPPTRHVAVHGGVSQGASGSGAAAPDGDGRRLGVRPRPPRPGGGRGAAGSGCRDGGAWWGTRTGRGAVPGKRPESCPGGGGPGAVPGVVRAAGCPCRWSSVLPSCVLAVARLAGRPPCGAARRPPRGPSVGRLVRGFRQPVPAHPAHPRGARPRASGAAVPASPAVRSTASPAVRSTAPPASGPPDHRASGPPGFQLPGSPPPGSAGRRPRGPAPP